MNFDNIHNGNLKNDEYDLAADRINAGTASGSPACGKAWSVGGGDDITIPTDKSETTEGQIKVITTTEYYETTELIEQGRVFCEDLGQISTNDFDFNDVVFDAYIYKITPQTRTIVEDEELGTTTGDYVDAGEPTYKTTIILLAAGGTLQLSVAGQEVHNALGASSTSTIVNTITSYEESYHNDYITADPVELGTDFTYSTIADIPIWVYYNENNILKLEAEPGMAPHKILVPIGTKWCKERKDIDKDVYLDFKAYVNSSQDFWEGRITEANLFVHPKDNYKERSKTPERKLDESKTTTKTTYRNGGSSTSGGYQGETVLSRELR